MRGPLFLDNLRLERDTAARGAFFDGLHAFDCRHRHQPSDGRFHADYAGTLYSPAALWPEECQGLGRGFDAMQPDPLYQDFLCIESGGLAVDVPTAKYLGCL